MEKKTMGKFIAVLRKANGMTQQELADKLLVSDKTVSKWERDDRMPDISLLPVMAEIFGITTDELLRGERNNPEREINSIEETEVKQKVKSDKQFNYMIDKKVHLYRNLSFISISLLIIAFIVATAVNFSAKRGDIAFYCSISLCILAEVCQLLFALNAWIKVDDGANKDKVVLSNNKIAREATAISFACLGSVAFYSPISAVFSAINNGYENVYVLAETFFLTGGLIMCCTLFAAFAIYVLFVKKALHSKGIIVMTDSEERTFLLNKSVMKKMSIAFICVVIVFGVTVSVVTHVELINTRYFSGWDQVKEYTESDYDLWIDETYGSNEVLRQVANIEYKRYGQLTYEDESRYDHPLISVTYYYHKDHIKNVITRQTDGNGSFDVEEIINHRVKKIAMPIVYSLIGADLVASLIIYLVLASKHKKKFAIADDNKAEESVAE